MGSAPRVRFDPTGGQFTAARPGGASKRTAFRRDFRRRSPRMGNPTLTPRQPKPRTPSAPTPERSPGSFPGPRAWAGGRFRRKPPPAAAYLADLAASKSVATVRQAARRNRLEPGGHSLRVGTAQDLAAKGAGLPEIQTAGRWADPKIVAPIHAGRRRRAAARFLHGR